MHTRRMTLFALVTSVAICTGCLRSIHPLHTPDTVTRNPDLVGTWVTDDRDTWTFSPGEGDAYRLVHRQRQHGDPSTPAQGTSAEFTAHLVRLADDTFLDLLPTGPPLRNDLFSLHLIPTHTFWRIDFGGDSLRIAALDERWFEDGIASGEIEQPHLVADAHTLLTAETMEVQTLVKRFASSEEAFANVQVLKRKVREGLE